MTKRILNILLLLIIVGALPGYACNCDSPKPDNEKWRRDMREFKLKFLAQEMELRQEQQKQFFILYTQMSDEKEAVMRSAQQVVKRVEKMGASATDADYAAASEAMQKARDQEIAIDKKYDEKFKAFLSAAQLFKMKEAERKFREKLREMRHQKK